MKDLKTIKKVLKDETPELERLFRVKKIGIFGSYARGDATKTSDIDILVELHEPIGWKLVDLRKYLENAIGTEVDLITLSTLMPQRSEKVLTEVVYV